MNERCSAIILAGGQSRRMGRPKAWLDFHGRPLLTHVAERLSARFDDVIIVAAPEQELPDTHTRVVRDEAPGEGPLAGMVIGLREAMHPLAFVTAVDAPLLRLEVVKLLIREIGDADAAVPEWDRRLQPLCAVYRAAAVWPVLAEQLQKGERRLMDALRLIRMRTVGEETLRQVDPDGLSFLAVNTPEQYEFLLELTTVTEDKFK